MLRLSLVLLLPSPNPFLVVGYLFPSPKSENGLLELFGLGLKFNPMEGLLFLFLLPCYCWANG